MKFLIEPRSLQLLWESDCTCFLLCFFAVLQQNVTGGDLAKQQNVQQSTQALIWTTFWVVLLMYKLKELKNEKFAFTDDMFEWAQNNLFDWGYVNTHTLCHFVGADINSK